MKFKFLLKSLVFFPFLFTACASTSILPPDWIQNLNNIYPRSEFITGRGQGATKREAETRALTVISQFFLTQVSDEQSTRAVWSTGIDNMTHVERQTMEETTVISQVDLMTVRFVEDSYYDPKAKTWETMAYIRRDEGWEVYQPVARRQSDTLLAIIEAANTDTVPFNAYLRYGNAFAYADSSEYSGVRAFANVLHPTNANILFSDADTALGSLLEKRLTAQQRSRIYIEVPTDYNNIIFQASVKALSSAGFTTDNNRNNATAYLHIQVEEGYQIADVGVSYFPVLTGIISGNYGSLFSFKIETTRQSAINPDTAKRRAYTALADSLESAFMYELSRYQNAMIKN